MRNDYSQGHGGVAAETGASGDVGLSAAVERLTQNGNGGQKSRAIGRVAANRKHVAGEGAVEPEKERKDKNKKDD